MNAQMQLVVLQGSHITEVLNDSSTVLDGERLQIMKQGEVQCAMYLVNKTKNCVEWMQQKQFMDYRSLVVFVW